MSRDVRPPLALFDFSATLSTALILLSPSQNLHFVQAIRRTLAEVELDVSMANPRQRRKTRSGSHKPVQHSRRAKKLLKKQPRRYHLLRQLCNVLTRVTHSICSYSRAESPTRSMGQPQNSSTEVRSSSNGYTKLSSCILECMTENNLPLVIWILAMRR